MMQVWVWTGAMLVVIGGGCGKVASPASPDAAADAPVDVDVLPCAPAPAGLLARWRGETTTSDDVGSYNGVSVGHLAYTSGRHGSAFALNGSDALVLIDDGETLWPAGSFSIEGWFNASKIVPDKGGRVVTKYDCGAECPQGQPSLWSLEIAPDPADHTGTIGHAQFAFRTSAGTPINATDTVHGNILDRAWHHMVGVRDNSARQAMLYIDGALVAHVDLVDDAALAKLVDGDQLPDPITIGATRLEAKTTYDQYLTGAVDDVAYYSQALTADEIQMIYSSRDGECR